MLEIESGLKQAVISEINKSYKSMLERNPTDDEMDLWLKEIFEKGHTVEDIAKLIRKSKEYVKLHDSKVDPKKLEEIFSRVLKRPIEEEELRYWKKKIIIENLSTEDYKTKLEKSEEYQLLKKNEIKEKEYEIWKIFQMLFSREANDKEMEYWKKQIIGNKIKLIDLIKALKNSEEYKMREYNEEITIPIQLKKFDDYKKFTDLFNNTQPLIRHSEFNKIAYYNQLPLSERFDEYLWILKNLKSNGNILDVGCCESLLCQELAKNEKLHVYGIDIREPDYEPKFNFFRESAEKTHFENEFFDQISIISSIEHFGFTVYSNKMLDENGDLKAMNEIKRILKKGGTVLITVPYGKGNTKNYRKYDKDRLEKLLEGFEITEKKILKQSGWEWKEYPELKLEELGNSEFYPNLELPNAICLIKAKLL